MTARLPRAAVLLAPALALLLYFPALRYGFVWDDINYISARIDLQRLDLLWATLTQPFLETQNYFRPLALLTLALEQKLASGPMLAHAVNLLLHALNAALVAALAWRLAPQERRAQAAAIAGLLYAAHPALIEPVCWISGRFDLLVTSFSLCALLADRSIHAAAPRAAVVALLFLCAALSKEMAAGLAPLLPLWHWMLLPDEPVARRAALHSSFIVLGAAFAAGLLYLALRHAAIGHLFSGGAAHDAPLRTLRALGGWWVFAVWPFGLTGPVHETGPLTPLLRALPMVGLLGSLLALTLAARALRTAGADKYDLLPLCALLAFLPAANLLPLDMQLNYVSDRFLALPLTLLALWAGLRLPPLRRDRAGLLAATAATAWLLAAIVCVLAGRTLWRSNLDLWTGAYQRAPQSGMVLDNVQRALYDNQSYEDSKRLFEFDVANGRDPGPMRRSIYASSLEQLGHGQEALKQMELALNSPVPILIRPQLEVEGGWLFLAEGRLAQAREHFARALQLQPNHPDAAYFMGVTLAALGEAGAEAARDHGLAYTPPDIREERARDFAETVERARQAAKAGAGASG